MMVRLASAALALCYCAVLAGCGGSRPEPVAARDSVPSQESTARVDALTETAGRSMPSKSVRTAPACDSVPALVAKAFPNAAMVRRSAEPFPHRVVMDSIGKIVGYEAFSDSAGTTARGYTGTVPLQIFFDRRGRPVRIYILDNYETPAYLDVVYRAGLLDKLLAYDPAKPDSVDAVTLATSSSRAIIEGVTSLATRVANELVAGVGSESH